MNNINDFIKSLNIFENVNNFFKNELPKSQKLKIINSKKCYIKLLQKLKDDKFITLNCFLTTTDLIVSQNLYFFNIDTDSNVHLQTQDLKLNIFLFKNIIFFIEGIGKDYSEIKLICPNLSGEITYISQNYNIELVTPENKYFIDYKLNKTLINQTIINQLCNCNDNLCSICFNRNFNNDNCINPDTPVIDSINYFCNVSSSDKVCYEIDENNCCTSSSDKVCHEIDENKCCASSSDAICYEIDENKCCTSSSDAICYEIDENNCCTSSSDKVCYEIDETKCCTSSSDMICYKIGGSDCCVESVDTTSCSFKEPTYCECTSTDSSLCVTTSSNCDFLESDIFIASSKCKNTDTVAMEEFKVTSINELIKLNLDVKDIFEKDLKLSQNVKVIYKLYYQNYNLVIINWNYSKMKQHNNLLYQTYQKLLAKKIINKIEITTIKHNCKIDTDVINNVYLNLILMKLFYQNNNSIEFMWTDNKNFELNQLYYNLIKKIEISNYVINNNTL